MSDALSHRLAAVWFADIAGYTGLASRNESDALRLVRLFQQAARDTADRFGGRIVKFTGDGALAEFTSTESAVRAADALAREFRLLAEAARLPSPALHFGMHVGEVASAPDGDLYGDGLNVAARLESLSAPGQILASEDVWRQLHQRPEFRFEPLGERTLEGRETPVKVYGLVVEGAEEWKGAGAGSGWRERSRGLRRTVTAGVTGARSRRSAAAGLGVAVLLAGTWAAWRSRPAPAFSVSPDVVAVMPFTVRGGDDLAYLSEGMVNLLGTKMNGTAELRSVDPQAVLEFVSRENRNAVDPERARAIAGRFGAGLYVVGDIVEAGGQLHIDASLYEVGEKRPAKTVAVEGSTGNLFSLVDRLVAQLLVARLEGPESELIGLAAMTTDSLAALKAYLEGERAYAAGRFTDALESYQRAVAIDSLFALAYHRLAMTATWIPRYDIAGPAVENAMRHGARLSLPDRLLVEAQHALLNSDLAVVEDLLRPYLDAHPDNMEAWFLYGDGLLHGNAYRGRSMVEAWKPFRRALEIKPDNMWPLDHLMWIAAGRGRFGLLDSLLQRVDRRSDFELQWRAARNFAIGNRADRDRTVAGLQDAEAGLWTQAMVKLVTYAPGGEATERVRRLLVEPLSTDREASRLSLLGVFDLSRGRPGAAQKSLAAFSDLDPAFALQLRAVSVTAPFFPVTRAELDALRAEVERWEAGSADTADGADLDPLYRAYLLGLIDIRLGDRARAARAAERLEEPAGSPLADRVGGFLAQSLRARLLLAEGRKAESLAALPSLPAPIPSGILFGSPVLHHPHDRFLRAELLREEGRPDEALGWYRGLTEGVHAFDLPYAAMSHRRMAEIHEAEGDGEQAAFHYASFAELWRESDAELQPLVLDAAARARTLAGEEAED